MKWSFASVGLIILGLFGIVIIMLFNDITVSNEQDYYTLKYATEAAMLESIDVAYYRLTGEVKMSQEKFVENFTRRFTETSTFGQGNYNIAFYQISEYPPKVSLRIYDATSDYNIYTYNSDVEATSTGIVNELSAILDGEKLDLKYKEAEKPKEAPKETPPSYTPPSNRPSYTPSYTPTYPFRPSSYIPSYPSTDYYVPSSGGGYDSGGGGGGGGGGCDNCCLCGTCGGYQCSAEGANEGDVLGRDLASGGDLNLGKNNDNWGTDANGDIVGNPGGGGDYDGGSGGSGDGGGSGGDGGGSGGDGGGSGGDGGGDGGGGGGCFLAGTKVMTIDGFKAINNLAIGDLVLTYNEATGNNEYHKVTNLFVFDPKESREYIINFTYDDGTILKVSSSHKFYIIRNNEVLWLAADKIKTGDTVMYSGKKYHKVSKIKTEKLTDYIFNISVENTHNFYVGEQKVLVHNVSATPIMLMK